MEDNTTNPAQGIVAPHTARLSRAFVWLVVAGLVVTVVAKAIAVIDFPSQLGKPDPVLPFFSTRLTVLIAVWLECLVICICVLARRNHRAQLESIFSLSAVFSVYRGLYFATTGTLLGCSCMGGFGFGAAGDYVQVGILSFLVVMIIGSTMCLAFSHSFHRMRVRTPEGTTTCPES